MSDLRAELEQIAAYTKAHPDLAAAHHWLYDLKHPRGGEPRYVVMGINPGESPRDWEISPTPTEETSRFDFHDEYGGGRSAIRWSKTCAYFLDDADYVLAELFFWSSRDTAEAAKRFGSIEKSPHLKFCRDLNQKVFAAYQLQGVVSPGINNYRFCADLYGLRHVRTHANIGKRIAEEYHDGKRPWLFTKHWSGAFGFGREEREQVREIIRGL